MSLSLLHSSPCAILLFCLLPVCVKSDASSDLDAVQEEFYQWLQKVWPQYGTRTGNRMYNDRLTDFSTEAFETQLAKIQQLMLKASAIDRGQLSRHRQYRYDVLMDTFSTFAKNYDWTNYGPLNPVNFLDGFHKDLDRVVEMAPLDTKEDFDKYISRLQAFPTMISQMMQRMNKSIRLGTTYHNASVKAVPAQIQKVLNGSIEDSALFAPFNSTLNSLSIPETQRIALKSRALTALQNLWTALGRLKTYMENTYMPHTRSTYGVYGLPSGREYYRACLKWHLSVDMSPEEVHQTGLREVDRITQLMQKVMTKQGFNGTVNEYFTNLTATPRFQMNTVEEILTGYEHIIHNRTYPKLPQLFKNIPPQPVVVRPLDFDGPFGKYSSGSKDGSRPGVFYANVFRPRDTNAFSMAALALHEAVPGHHLQAIYRTVSDLPNYEMNRFSGDYYDIPFQFPSYTAHGEGWALYAEYLGEEMGVYENDYELMGRYGSEMFRACRLVADTGLHYMGWSYAKALKYFTDRTPIAKVLLEIEIDRYLTWPGQACAYKIGELKIKELRQKATQALGSKFNIRDFHSLLLYNGRFSLNVMEAIVNDYIADNTDTSPRNQGSVPHVYCLSACGVGIHFLLASLVLVVLQR